MSGAAWLLAALTALSAGGAAALVLMLVRLRRQTDRLAQVIDPSGALPSAEALAVLVRQAEAGRQLPRLNSRLAQLLDHSPAPLLLLDAGGAITGISQSAAEAFEHPRPGRGLLETLGSHELETAAREALEEMAPARLDIRLYVTGRRPFRALLFPYETETGSECLLFLQDATAMVNYGELRSQFAANVSHELRTPLAGIRATVETLLDPDISEADRARFLERISGETGHLEQLIEEILFLSALESGAAISLEGETDLGELTGQLTEKLAAAAREFEVSVAADIPPGLKLPLPERLTAIVLTNLMENAIKYSGRGSGIEVTGGKEGGRVWLKVRDNGVGIEAEHLPHIFERFYRVDKSRSRRLGGTGLGLSIVKHVAEYAGGEVGVQSREGFGTEVTVWLPIGDVA